MKFLNCLKSFFSNSFGLFFSFFKFLFSKRVTIWYIIWFIVASIYLYFHWNEAMVFSPFNGNSLILCVWIGMILKPFIGEIDTPWIKAKMNEAKNEAKAEQKESKENFEEAVKKAKEERKEIEKIQEREVK